MNNECKLTRRNTMQCQATEAAKMRTSAEGVSYNRAVKKTCQGGAIMGTRTALAS